MKVLCGLIAGLMMVCAAHTFAAERGKIMDQASMSVKKVLVVYYSRSGHTKAIAEELARRLQADIEPLIDKKDRAGMIGYLKAGRDATKERLAEIEPVKYDPATYDLVVVGTPVWGWNMTPAVRTYLTNHKGAIKTVAIFTSAGGTKPDKIVAKIEALTGKKAVASVGFFDNDQQEKNRGHYDAKITVFIERLK